MSTQHPDNVKMPFFVDSQLFDTEDEIKEAYYAFAYLGCEEQMWDSEGKEADTFVVKKLLSKYESYFQKKVLGEDVFLTIRVPNPRIEKNEGKVLLETLESIPKHYDVAQVFYGKNIAPIFEVILPMTTSAEEIISVDEYYKKFVVGKEQKCIGNTCIKEWIGEFNPKEINVIPLLEDEKSIMNIDEIVKPYLQKDGKKEYQRIFLAYSDPAENYGFISAALMNKIALEKIDKLSEKMSIDLYPIIGFGSVPFRGNFNPKRVKDCLQEFQSVQTYTVQSSFKYDHERDDVTKAIDKIRATRKGKAKQIDDKKAKELIAKYSDEYQRQVEHIADLINGLNKFVPARRKRALHIGLFGYSRKTRGIKLPRAINFCAALYSAGIPPEILGLNSLHSKDYDFLYDCFPKFETDLKDALPYFNENSEKFLPKGLFNTVKEKIKELDIGINEKHKQITDEILENYSKNRNETLTEDITRAAVLRKFLG